MSRPGFYNDNEYRVYPFIDQPAVLTALPINLPHSAIVDVGFIMGLDCEFDDAINTVYLARVQNIDSVLRFTFAIGNYQNGKTITFTRPLPATEWLMDRAASAVDTSEACASEPVWEGFLVTGDLTELADLLALHSNDILFAPFTQNNKTIFPYQVEPARIQNLNKAYLRSISIGNFGRTTVPTCDGVTAAGTPNSDPTKVEVSKRCMTGPLLFKEGYNCRISQNTRTNTITITGEKNAGAPADEALCLGAGEVPFTPDHPKDADGKFIGPDIYNYEKPDGSYVSKSSKFLSGGWACNDLIFTINGVGGPNVNLIGGQYIQISGDAGTNTLTVTLDPNAQGKCNT
jgi:hypothetical protein